ncbi:putative serine acetyltransferase 2 [Capsicum baccatum]|uniref:Serine acetyltransferase 2 n=1 Tax=Capsicum baccatum TaxID=33114 RepID=A0A2G2VHY3_CAPBA|nr:putative serine acetyltransferase 2 [Capsicum baccatum]
MMRNCSKMMRNCVEQVVGSLLLRLQLYLSSCGGLILDGKAVNMIFNVDHNIFWEGQTYKGVTLGGTEKEIGDRHPKIGQGVLIGASVTILGNIKVGEGEMVGADSLVLKDVPPHRISCLTDNGSILEINEESSLFG